MAFGDLCFETYDTMCNIFNEPFAAVLKPFDAVLGGPDGLGGIGGLTIAVIWGIIVGVLWLKTGNLMLVSIIKFIKEVVILQNFYQVLFYCIRGYR